jgi:hypothetical protein
LQCVPACGGCTTNADCCPGSACIQQAGMVSGVCGPCGGTPPPPADGGSGSSSGGPTEGGPPPPPPDASTSCALYGQICTTSANCCAGIPCTAGHCYIPPM